MVCAYILSNDDRFGGHIDSAECAANGQSIPIGGTLKRVFDVLAASLTLVVLAPLVIFVAALVRLLLGGPVLFAQKRVGFGGKTFDCYRFRTIRPDQANDPRVTCLSNVLRQLGIDQLPQLFNVLRGDMSVVGPQAARSDEIQRHGHYARAYFSARPGLTGLWEANGCTGNVGRIASDCYYARHWSLGLDLLLLLKAFRS
jgi:exopolysaccharide production protein ExoY